MTVGAERYGIESIAVLGEGQDFPALVPSERRRVPNANGLVDAGRGEAVAGWLWAGKVCSGGPPASASQSLGPTCQAPDVARRRPSRLNATGIEWNLCPEKVCRI